MIFSQTKSIFLNHFNSFSLLFSKEKLNLLSDMESGKILCAEHDKIVYNLYNQGQEMIKGIK